MVSGSGAGVTTPAPEPDTGNTEQSMKKLEEVKWGIIGVGDVTEVKSGPAFYKVEHSSLVAVMRRDARKAADYAKRHNVQKWYSVDQ